jgi:hypothetical protein
MAKEIQVIHMQGTQAEREAISGATDKLIIWHEPDGSIWQSHATGWTQTHGVDGVLLVSIGGSAGTNPVLVTLGTLISGEVQAEDLIKVEQRYDYRHIATATTTAVKASPGFLHSLTVNTTAAGAITIYDSLAASGDVIAILKASIGENTFTFNVNCDIGITVVTAAASDITVSFR